jgi:hypothetical protein
MLLRFLKSKAKDELLARVEDGLRHNTKVDAPMRISGI